MGCLVTVVSYSRVVGSATVYIMLIYVVGSLVFVWPVPGMWAVGS